MTIMFAHLPIVRDILLGAEKYGADLLEMCTELSINPTDLHNSEIQVPFEQAYRAWEIAVDRTGDKLLGLHLGEQTNPSILGLVGHLMQSCKNLAEAFQSVCSFSSVATDMFQYSISSKGNQTVLSYEPCTPWLKVSSDSARQAAEQAMAGTLHVFQILSGKKIQPAKTEFSFRKPKNPTAYERVFQSPIKWNCDSNSLIFETTQLRTPVLSYDESLIGVFNHLIEQRLNKLKREAGIEKQIKKEILTTFKGQLPGLEAMAARFNMTTRSLQRKLEDANSTYRIVCSDLGKELATALLKKENVKVAEVASALGYSDPRAFQRAFKSWTGMSPGEFRKEN